MSESFISDEEVLERMKDFYEKILPPNEPAEAEQKEDKKVFRPVFDYSEEAMNAIIIARTLLKDPFLNFSSLIRAAGLSKAKAEAATGWLQENGFVEEHQISVGGSGKPGKYFEITRPALALLGGKAPFGKGSFQHKCYSHKIKDFFVHHGLDIQLEGRLEGMRGAFDVYATKKGFKSFGVEVTLSFENLLENVSDGLRSSVDELIIVTENKEEMEKAKKIVPEQYRESDRLSFKTIGEFKTK